MPSTGVMRLTGSSSPPTRYLEGGAAAAAGAYGADRAASRPAGESRCHALGLACGHRRTATRRAKGIELGQAGRRRRFLRCAPMTGSNAPESYRPLHPARRLCADRHPGRLDHRRGDALGDDKRLAVPSRAAARPQLAGLDRGPQRDPRARRPQQHQAQRRADRHRPLLVRHRPAGLESDRAPARGREEARPRRQRAPVRARLDGNGAMPSSPCSTPSITTISGGRSPRSAMPT